MPREDRVMGIKAHFFLKIDKLHDDNRIGEGPQPKKWILNWISLKTLGDWG